MGNRRALADPAVDAACVHVLRAIRAAAGRARTGQHLWRSCHTTCRSPFDSVKAHAAGEASGTTSDGRLAARNTVAGVAGGCALGRAGSWRLPDGSAVIDADRTESPLKGSRCDTVVPPPNSPQAERSDWAGPAAPPELFVAGRQVRRALAISGADVMDRPPSTLAEAPVNRGRGQVRICVRCRDLDQRARHIQNHADSPR